VCAPNVFRMSPGLWQPVQMKEQVSGRNGVPLRGGRQIAVMFPWSRGVAGLC